MTAILATGRWGRNHKLLLCPLCKKRFASTYAKAYHEANAKRLCPKYKDEKHANDQ